MLISGGIHLKQVVDELEARRAVAGVDVDIMEKLHVPPAEADAITVALRYYLVGDEHRARAVLQKVFVNGTVGRILAEFSQIADLNDAAA